MKFVQIQHQFMKPAFKEEDPMEKRREDKEKSGVANLSFFPWENSLIEGHGQLIASCPLSVLLPAALLRVNAFIQFQNLVWTWSHASFIDQLFTLSCKITCKHHTISPVNLRTSNVAAMTRFKVP